MITRLIGVICGYLLGFTLGCTFEYVTNHWESKIINNPQGKTKQFFCDHKEEECIQAIPLPYSHHNAKCCLKCKKCGCERWVNWYFNNGISECTPIPAPYEEKKNE